MDFAAIRRAMENPVTLVAVSAFMLLVIVGVGMGLDAFLRYRRREKRRHNFKRSARKSIRDAAAAEAERKAMKASSGKP